jgi:hypothetical protein
MPTTRRERLLAVLERHPAGLCADRLLEETGTPPEQRQAMLKAIRNLAQAGQVRVTCRSSKWNDVAGALVEPVQ